MEYHGTRLSAPARRPRPEPSWPTVIATTVRLWLERHPVAGRRGTRGRHVAVALAVVAAVALGAGVAAAVVGHASGDPGAVSAASAAPQGSRPGSAGAASAAATRGDAATWIAQQVASSAVVSCDPAMCAALQAAGLPAARLLVLGTDATDPLGSDVVVATAAVRNEFGTRLASVYAPAVIATFGSGSGRIDIRAIAPDGAAAYRSDLAADRRSRVSAGTQLLRNPHITVATGARAALSAGDVDPRLLLLLAALAAQQPVRVSAFGDPSPGASQAVPLRGATLAPLRSGAASSRAMLSFIRAQQEPFLPLRASVVGPSAVTVEYAAPSPLGLLGGP
jgi:hypothetical protein